MDLNDLGIFSMMTKRMAWLTKRQRVLAHNIANSDTPGYRPYDLKAQNFSKHLRPQGPVDPSHCPAGENRPFYRYGIGKNTQAAP